MEEELHPRQEQILELADKFGGVNSNIVVTRLGGDWYRQLANHHLDRLEELGYLDRLEGGMYLRSNDGYDRIPDASAVDPDDFDFTNEVGGRE